MILRYFILCLFLLSISPPAPVKAANLNLTTEEVKWIERHKTARYSIDPRWQPIEYLDGENAAGLTVAYLKKISDITGMQFKFIKTSSWIESINLLTEGRVDLVPGVPDFDIPSSLIARAKLSTPYFVATTVVVTNARNRIISDFSNFSTNDIIAIRGGGAYESWIREKYPNIKIATFESIEGALGAVLKGSATAAIGPEPILHPIIRQRYGKSLFLAGVMRDLPIALRIGTTSTIPELQSIVQKALSAISAEESDRIQEEWVEDADFGRPSLAALLKYYGARMGGILFVFLLTVLALFQAWRARGAIEEVAQQRAAFLSIMAHEIRNPLNYILASIELASTQSDKAMMQHYIKIAAHGGESLGALLSNALDYSKIEKSKITIDRNSAFLTDILSPIMPAVGIEAERNGLELKTSISRDLDGQFIFDKVKLRQVITNIISNSIKFTDCGSISLFVEREMTSSVKNIVFRVVDTGVGMPRRELSKITRPFYQIKNQNKENIGVGLGLAICNELIRAMHGEFSIFSSVGNGTTVVVKIPLEEAPEENVKNRFVEAGDNFYAANVLVVEDVISNRNIIKSQVEHLGCSATAVESGREAIEIISNQKFDIILLDCNLPDISGYEVARSMRGLNHPDISTIPIIAISADSGEQHLRRCLDSGMDGAIAKPVNLLNLREVLNAWTKGERNNSEYSASNLSGVPDEDVLSGLRVEAVEVLRCALKKDSDGTGFHGHRLKGIVLSFEYRALLDFMPDSFDLKNNQRGICKKMIIFIRKLDSGIFQEKRGYRNFR